MTGQSGMSSLRRLLNDVDGPLFASWHALGSPFAIETAAAQGWDVALVDQQHGIGGNEAMLAGLLAARAARVPGIVRVGWNDPTLVSRALDAGAAAIVCPMVNSSEDAVRLRDAAKYPPIGCRSWGPYRAAMISIGDYGETANGETLTFPQIETSEALNNLESILDTDGIDGALVGPNDLALSLTGKRDIRASVVVDALRHIRKACVERSLTSWVFANDGDYARDRLGEGWDIISIGTDAGWLTSAAGSHRAVG